MFDFYNVLFLADVLHVVIHEFTYDPPTPLKSDVYDRSRKSVEKQAQGRGGGWGVNTRGGSYCCRKATKCSHTFRPL